jgi:hypothetical protein
MLQRLNQFRAAPVPGAAFKPARAQPVFGLQAGDCLQFGAARPNPPFMQHKNRPTAGTKAAPVSPNNCLVCSAKNLLIYFGCCRDTADHVIQDALTCEIREGKHFKEDSPYFQQENSDFVELNNHFVRSFLASSGWGLNMHIQPLLLDQSDQIKQAIEARRPIWVFAEGDDHTLAVSAATDQGGKHRLAGGHAYLVTPDQRDPAQWKVVDAWAGETTLSAEQLIQNLSTMRSRQSQYNVVLSGPDHELIRVYQPEKRPASGRLPAGAEPPSEPAPASTACRQPQSGAQQVVQQAPPALGESASPGAEFAPAVKQNAKAPKPVNVDLSRWKRVTLWLKSQWLRLTESLKRWGRWLKSLVSKGQ